MKTKNKHKILDGWKETNLGKIGKVAMCKRIFKNETSQIGDIPFYKIKTFGRKQDSFINVDLYTQYKNKYPFPNKGDILISSSGTIGRLVIYDGRPAYFQDSNIIWLAHDGDSITNKFLYYVYNITKWNTEGSTIKRLYNNNFLSTKILIPKDIKEQKAIVEVLETWEKGVELLRKKVELEKNIRKGLMQQLLNGKKRLPGFDKKWENEKLYKCAEIKTGERVTKNELDVDNKYPVFSGGITPMGYFVKYNQEPNTITVVKYGTAGFVNFIKEKFWANDVCYCIKPNNEVNNKYLFYFLKYREAFIKSKALSATPLHLPTYELNNIKVSFPSTIEEQRAIVEVLETQDKKIELLEKKLSLWEDQKKFLINNLVTGKIRLPNKLIK